ncbi:claudin-34-like isoform 1-T2 [Fundulus diaphanus]
MTYLAHTAHAQFAALCLALIGWTLTAMAPGLIQWRVWEVPGSKVVTSGVAWVGIWRACFNSHALVSEGLRSMFCRSIRLTESFTPPEIAAGQVLMLLSLLVGLAGNAAGVYAMRMAYFGKAKVSAVCWGFISTGVLVLLAALLSFVPLIWNLSSVVANRTIDFPEEFKLPKAPRAQHAGCGIAVGLVGSVLMALSGLVFCSYRPGRDPRLRAGNRDEVGFDGTDNPAFQSHERL